MRRIRHSVPTTLSLGLLVAGCSMTLSAYGQGLSRSDMESFVYAIVAAAGVCVVGAFWILLMTFTGRTERAVEKLVVAMQSHHEDPLAHPAGSANRINPVMERLGEIEDKMAKTHEILLSLHAEHRIIRKTEDDLCALVHKKMRSEKARRETDPEDFNGEVLRKVDP